MAQKDAKIAALKKGGGTFTYDGSALDSEAVPAELDAAGRVKRAAQLRHTKIATYKIAGVSFEAGKAVRIDNSVLALKLRSLGCFVEGEEKPSKAKVEAKQAE